LIEWVPAQVAIEAGAVNLSQGFPNEPPPRAMVAAAAGALLAGASAESAAAAAARLLEEFPAPDGDDALNQYSFPYGAPELRRAIEAYYAKRAPALAADASENVTVTMGATEGFAASIRALTAPGDAVAFFQPFHELYPSQLAIFGLEARAVTLSAGFDRWSFDPAELDRALRGAKLFLFNDPHNPTGHRFSLEERTTVARLCEKHGVVCVTDEIYEHMTFDGPRYASLAELYPEGTVVVNSISKTAKATGWRIGWVVASAARTSKIRGVHDQLVACCPTPLQHGVAALLRNPDDPHFARIAPEYLRKRDMLAASLQKAGFWIGPLPKGSYYLFVGFASVPALRGLGPTEAAILCGDQHLEGNAKVRVPRRRRCG